MAVQAHEQKKVSFENGSEVAGLGAFSPRDRWRVRLSWKGISALKRFFQLLARLRLTWVIGSFLILVVRASEYRFRKRWGVTRSSGPRVLAFDRPIFTKDLVELARRTDLTILPMPPLVHSVLFQAFHPPGFKRQFEYHRLTSPAEQDAKARAQALFDRFIPQVVAALGVDLVFTANIDYATDQPWLRWCKANGLPFKVFLKEGIPSQSYYDWIVAHYIDLGYTFEGDLIILVSELKRDSLLEAGVAPPERMVVAGIPRTDLVFEAAEASRASASRDWVVLFSFNTQPQVIDGFSPREFWEVILGHFMDVVRDGSELPVRFLVKAKDERDFLMIRAALAKSDARHCPEVVHDLGFAELIQHTKVAIGFNTTALLELMTTDVPVVTPIWGKAERNPDTLMLPAVRDSAAYLCPGSPAEFKEVVLGSARGPQSTVHSLQRQREERRGLIDRYVHRIDGRRSERVAELLRSASDSTEQVISSGAEGMGVHRVSNAGG